MNISLKAACWLCLISSCDSGSKLGSTHVLFCLDDLNSVRWSNIRQPLPDNPERFDIYPWCLVQMVLTQGTHCWDVEVKGSSSWGLGITTASNQRNGGDFFFNTNVWSVQYEMLKTLAFLLNRAWAVRVDLDYERGTVSFSDPVTNTHLHTFTTTFTDTVLPFFHSIYPLKLLPLNYCRSNTIYNQIKL